MRIKLVSKVWPNNTSLMNNSRLTSVSMNLPNNTQTKKRHKQNNTKKRCQIGVQETAEEHIAHEQLHGEIGVEKPATNALPMKDAEAIGVESPERTRRP